jgi:hypothetical protein
MEQCLYYSKMALPKIIRIKSSKLQLDHTFFPFSEVINLNIVDYKNLLIMGYFDDVLILPSDNDEAYVVGAENERVYINQWISLNDFERIELI